MSPFNSKFKVTQPFGVNQEYYKEFGLTAHEGIDLVPTGTTWDILCLEDGIVITDQDNPLSGVYGIFLTVWHPSIGKATQYCHLKENYVTNGDHVSKGQKLGFMGNTGNTSGAHLHLNLFETDPNGFRLNRDNGYLGGIDPLPFLEETSTSQPTTSQEILNRADAFIAVCTELGVAATKDAAITAIRAKDTRISELEDLNQAKERKNTELAEKATELEKRLSDATADYKALLDNYTASQKVLEEKIGELSELTTENKELQEKIKQEALTPWEHLVKAIMGFVRR